MIEEFHWNATAIAVARVIVGRLWTVNTGQNVHISLLSAQAWRSSEMTLAHSL
jgi:hypothetical protein